MQRYYLKQAVFSLRDSFKVFDESQRVVYHAHAKMLSISRQYNIYRSSDERLLFTMKRRLLSFMPVYELCDAAGRQVAIMRKRFAMFKNRIDIEAEGRGYLLEGNIWAHNFTVSSDGKPVLTVRKKLLSWGDTYEIEIAEDGDTDKLIAFVIMIDSIFHRKKSN